MATREERERKLLADLKAKYEPAPKKTGRRAADDDDPGEVIVATGRKATDLLKSLVGWDDDQDDDDQDDDDQDDDDHQDDDEPDDELVPDDPPRGHGFYRPRGRRR